MYTATRTRVKICCIASSEEAQLAIRSGADALGFVCVQPASHRTIDKQMVADLSLVIPPPIDSFVLTSGSTASDIEQDVLITRASTVQIISHIDLSESKKLAERTPHVRRVQVIHVENAQALDLIELYAPYVHAFLLDSGRPSSSTPDFGGTGRTHDWSISAEFVRRSPLPVFLAGGLNPENVGEAIRVVRPYGVDVCSGLHSDDRLDPKTLQAFMAAVRKTDLALMHHQDSVC